MKNKITIFTTIFLLCLISVSFAQKEIQECKTESLTLEEKAAQPWYGNNQYLLNLVDSIEGNISTMRTEAVNTNRFLVPVQAWVWHRDDGSGTVPSLLLVFSFGLPLRSPTTNTQL